MKDHIVGRLTNRGQGGRKKGCPDYCGLLRTTISGTKLRSIPSIYLVESKLEISLGFIMMTTSVIFGNRFFKSK